MHLVLGSLEREVMEFIWSRGEVSVRDFFEQPSNQLAYTTIMTTVDRLHKKRLVDRPKNGKAFLYIARQTKTEFLQASIRHVMNDLFVSDPRPLLASLIEGISERDRTLLDELERLVKAAQTRKG
jgi:predicted transcriptional regulator